VEGRVLLGRVISEQRCAVSIIVPLIRYVHSYVILQMDRGPIRAGVIQSHNVTSGTQWRHRHTVITTPNTHQ